MTGPPSDKITPMLRQYLDLKERYADALVLFQMGDFYETFFGDAETAANALTPVHRLCLGSQFKWKKYGR